MKVNLKTVPVAFSALLMVTALAPGPAWTIDQSNNAMNMRKLLFAARTAYPAEGSFSQADTLKVEPLKTPLLSTPLQKPPETQAYVLGLCLQKTGSRLQTYRAVHYAGNIAQLLGYALGPVKVTQDIDGEDSLEMNWVAVAVIGGGTIAKLVGRQFIGSAGTKMVEASQKPSLKQFDQFNDCGNSLKGYMSVRNAADVGTLAAVLTLVIGAGNENTAPLMYLSFGLNLASLIMLYDSPRRVGEAGSSLNELSGFISSPEPQKLISQAGKSLKTYSLLSYIGLGLSTLGTGFIIGGSASDDDALTDVGGPLAITGQVLSSWVAPWFVGAAGDKLKRAGKIIIQS